MANGTLTSPVAISPKVTCISSGGSEISLTFLIIAVALTLTTFNASLKPTWTAATACLACQRNLNLPRRFLDGLVYFYPKSLSIFRKCLKRHSSSITSIEMCFRNVQKITFPSGVQKFHFRLSKCNFDTPKLKKLFFYSFPTLAQRQSDIKTATGAGLLIISVTFHPNFAPMRQDDAPRNRQAQAWPAPFEFGQA